MHGYWILSSKTVYATLVSPVFSLSLEASNVSSVKKKSSKSMCTCRLCALTISCLNMGIGVDDWGRCCQDLPSHRVYVGMGGAVFEPA